MGRIFRLEVRSAPQAHHVDARPSLLGYHQARFAAQAISTPPRNLAMKLPYLAVLLALVAAPLVAEDKPLNTPPEGFTALFNGKDLTGWKGLVGSPKTRAAMSPDELAKKQAEADKIAREHWTVEDGVLVYSGKGKMSLCTVKDYANFELYVD